MIVVDANLLLYAYNTSAPHHGEARRWWETCLSEPIPVGLPWATLLAFIRIGTHQRVFRHPLTLEEATHDVAAWLERPMVITLEPGARHWEILSNLLVRTQAPGNLVPDAHLAALAIEHGATLCSADRDFARFPGLRWENPLDEAAGSTPPVR